jgi:hypothetical protein
MDCKDDPPIPPDNTPQLGKRNYTWTMDTIAYPGSLQTLMSDIWGSSPNDVYIVGHNESPPGPGTMYRYDGIKWSVVNFHKASGGTIEGAMSLSGIYSFSKNDVWAVGNRLYDNPNRPPNFLDSSLIIHYNGINWHEHKIEGGRGLLTVWGTDSNNVWVGGLYGTLYHFDGTTFQKQSYRTDLSIATITGVNPQNVYIRAYLQGQPIDSYFLLEKFNGVQWTLMDSTKPYPYTAHFGTSYVWPVDTSTIYTAGEGGVFKKTAAGWEKVLDIGSEILASIRGNKGNNLFAVGRGMIYHFNGEDWYKYNQFLDQNIIWIKTWTDGNEVFIVGQTITGTDKTIVLHGK